MKVAAKVIFNRIPELTALMRSNTMRIIADTTLSIEREVKESMQGPKSGRAYPRASGKMHQASSAGEAPAIDAGVLVNSIQSEFDGLMHGVVFTNTEYAEILEFGGVHLAERPFMRPAATKVWPEFYRAMQGILGR